MTMEASNYRIAFNTALEKVKNKDPAVIAKNAGIEYLADSQAFFVPFFENVYFVDCSGGQVIDKHTGQQIDFCTSVIILNYLSYAQNILVDKQPISLKEIPNGGMIFYPAFKLYTVDRLVSFFAARVEALYAAAVPLGGKPVNMGHAAVRFHAFPKISLTVILWEGDEEVCPTGTVLFDRSIDSFLPVEDIIGLGGYCVDRLISGKIDPSSL